MGRLRDDRTQQDLDDLGFVLGKCGELLPVLQALMGEQPGFGPRGSTISRNAPESKEPWNPEASNAYWMIWFGSRVLADRMRVSLGLGTARWSAGENGLEVIGACASIVEASLLRSAVTSVRRWHETALQIRDIDEADRWIPIPRDLSARPPQCPYCRTMSLRLNRARGLVRCLFPGCVDSEGNETTGRMEYEPDGVQGMVVFGDNRRVTYRKVVA